MSGAKLPKKRARGFTLIELLVVIGIIGVTAAVALPSLTGWVRANRIRTAQREVAENLQRARMRGITRNTQYGLVFALQDNRTYWIHQEDPRNIIDADTLGADAVSGRQPLDTAAPAPDKDTRYILPEDVRFAANDTECPDAFVADYTPSVSAIRFDKYGVQTVPGQASAPALAAGTSALLAGVHYVAGTDVALCLFDTRTQLRRVVRIAPGGRIRMQ